MKIIMKRALSLLLTMALVVTLLSAVTLPARAEEDILYIYDFQSLGSLSYFVDSAPSLEQLKLELPATVTASVNNLDFTHGWESPEITVADWASDPAYDPDTPGLYSFFAEITVPNGYAKATCPPAERDMTPARIDVRIKALPDEVNVSSFEELKSEITSLSQAETGKIITVTNSFAITELITIMEWQKTLTIKGSASNITLTRGVKGDLITVGSSLTLEDITIDGGSTGSFPDGGGSLVKATAAFTMNNAILQNNMNAAVDSKGGGVYAGGFSSFTMNSGAITGCSASVGGGVYVDWSSLKVSGSANIEGVYLNTTSIEIGSGGLSAGASIGIEGMDQTAEDTPVVWGATTGDEAYFHISNSEGKIGENDKLSFDGNGRIVLASKYVNAKPPQIIQDLTNNYPNYTVGDVGPTLTVEAIAADGGTISYQWYRCTVWGWETNGPGDSTPIDGATNSSYTVPTTTASAYYYYVIATNTITDNDDGGNKTATTRIEYTQIFVIYPPLENINFPVTAPVTGATPQTDMELYNFISSQTPAYNIYLNDDWGTRFWWGNGGFTSEGKFMADSVYSLDVLLYPCNNNEFQSYMTLTVDGASNVVGYENNRGNEAGFTITFNPTAPLEVTNIVVKSQPNTLSYTDKTNLDLTGLGATVTYNDGTTAEVPYTNFASHTPSEITMTYSGGGTVTNGDVLTVSAHHDKRIVLTCNGKIAETSALTVTYPDLGGTATISGTNEIGEQLTMNTDSVTGGTEPLHYQWKADGADISDANSRNYTITGADAGKIITCVVTRDDAQGSVTATLEGGVVPYNIAVSMSGNTGTDNVTLSASTGSVGESITVSYTLDNSGSKSNTITFSAGLSPVTTAGTDTQTYSVNATDAVSGVITITATFLHSDLDVQTITFASGNQTKTFGGTQFTNAVSGGDGTGAITYQSSNESVAKVDNSGTVTIVGAGSATITATKAADANYAEATASYTLTVRKADQAAPSVGKTDETAVNANDGKITGVTTAMEYKFGSTGAYTAITGTEVTGLAPGTYNVRYAAKTNYNASLDATVEIIKFVVAQDPTINTQPSGGMVALNGEKILIVAASVGDGGILSYQWYNASGAISGATDESYTAPTNNAGEFSYYVVVANTNNNVSGTKTALIQSSTATVTVNPEPILAASVTVATPVAGETPQTLAQIQGSTNTAKYTVTEFLWNEECPKGKFAWETEYTASVTLTATSNYRFQETSFTPTVSGARVVGITTTNGGFVAGNSVTFTITFPQTAAVAVTGITIATQPVLTYNYGDMLDLSALVATLTYNSGATKNVAYADFAANGITVSYSGGGAAAHGNALTVAAHHGTTIVLTCNSQIAATGVLAVAKATRTIPAPSGNATGSNEVMLSEVTPSDGDGNVEYGYATTDNSGSVNNWQSELTFTGLTASTTYYFFARVTGSINYEDATSSGTAITTSTTPTYGITLDPSSGKTFSAAVEGYGAQTVHSVTINNTGNQPTGALTIALSGTNAGNFMLSKPSISTIAPGESDSFTVVPNTGLTTGIYTATVTVSGGNGISSSFAVEFAVNAPSHTVTFNLNGGTHTGGGALSQTVVLGGTAIAPETVRSGYTFNGWDMVLTNITAETTITAIWMINYAPPTSSKPNSTPAPTPEPTSSTSTVVVDGKEVSAGEVSINSGTTTVTVKQEVIQQQIETAANNITVVVPAETGTAVAQLAASNVNDMAAKEMTFSVQVGAVVYELPTTAIDTSSVLAALGVENAADVPISISINTDMSEAAKAVVNSVIEADGAALIIPPIEFKITATYNDQSVEISTFSQYVSRAIEVTAEQAGKITTAIVVEPDGTTRQVPTRVYQKDGRWYGEINSLTNSAYAVINNEITFADAIGKWYEAAVNEMGSRKIIGGIGGGQFAGERDITRAEFAAILVRALGLRTDSAVAIFSDVPRSAWYCGAVGAAYEFGLAAGVGNGRFSPDKKITRQEAMLMIERAAKIMSFTGNVGSLDTFTDANTISEWALDAVLWNVGSGLIVGSGGKIRGVDNITRAETATLVLKLLQKAELVDVRTKF